MSEDNNANVRRWMLVINNPTFKESEFIYNFAKDPNVAGMMWSAEHAHEEKENEEKNLTQHYHIYLSLKTPRRFHWIKERFPRAKIQPAHTCALQCCRYVAKEGFYMTFGNVPNIKTGGKQGSQRSRERAENMAREEVVRKIRRGELRFQQLSDEQLLDTKLVRAAKDAATMTQGPMRPDVYICCFVSPTGWGKSYSVWETFQRVASVEFGGTQEWFLDAEQDVMLFDEFCGQVRAQKMLKYLDMYPISLPIKGGHRPCYWKLIFICSNTPPDEWYMKDDPKTGLRISSIPEEVRKALYRRIGYPSATARGETHVYSDTFTTLLDAQKEMKEICVRLHQRIYPEGTPDRLRNEDADNNQEIMEAERRAVQRSEQQDQEEQAQLRRMDADLHEHLDDIREIQAHLEQVIAEYQPSPKRCRAARAAADPDSDDEPTLNPDDMDSCPDPPPDSDDDSDFEH